MFVQGCIDNSFTAFQHELSITSLDLGESSESISKKMMKFFSAITFCFEELGIWLASKVY